MDTSTRRVIAAANALLHAIDTMQPSEQCDNAERRQGQRIIIEALRVGAETEELRAAIFAAITPPPSPAADRNGARELELAKLGLLFMPPQTSMPDAQPHRHTKRRHQR